MTSTLLVATHGGHFSELEGLYRRIVDLGEPRWITNRHPQTTLALDGESVEFVPFIDSRDVRGVLASLPLAFRTLRSGEIHRVVSTGSAIALGWLPLAALLGVPAHYIESSTRIAEPSITGRILAKLPGVTTWWQHADPPPGWRPLAGLYANYWSELVPAAPVKDVVVTVGTTDMCFRRLIERLVAVIPPDVNVFWQVGDSDTTGLDIDAHTIVDSAELHARIANADVVVTHAGAGSLLLCLQEGKAPVYVPRLARFGEQIDDHQVELANHVGGLGLAVTADASTLTWHDIIEAGRHRIQSRQPEPIQLEVA